jgi:hypothetical protein
VFCNRNLIGYLTGKLPEWDSGKAFYQFARGGKDGPADKAVPVSARTIFDGFHRAVALEIADTADLAACPEFRYLGE